MAGNAKYTVIAFLGIAIAIGVGFFTIRSIADGIGGDREMSRDPGNFVEQRLDLSETEEISVEGVWSVEVRSADEGRGVEITAPPEFIDYVREQSDEKLVLGIPGGFRRIRGTLRAVVYSDELEKIGIQGASQVEMTGINFGDLLIEVEGAGSIESEDVTVENLRIQAEGAANVDFMDSSVVNAEINIEGAAKVDLNMGGGSLTGSLEGIGKVRYRGEVSNREFSIDGLGSIEYLD